MANQKITAEEVEGILQHVPEEVERIRRSSSPVRLEDIFGARSNAAALDLKNKGFTILNNGNGVPFEVAADLDESGHVVALAARVSTSASGNSYDYVRSIEDYRVGQSVPRNTKIPQLYKIYMSDGFVNNALNKQTALVSSEGNFYIRSAKRGNRKQSKAESALLSILNYWKRNVNSNPNKSITSSRGLEALLNQGTRVALIEGSWVAFLHDSTVEIPSLGESAVLPMHVQTMSTQYLEIPTALAGTMQEQFIWRPTGEALRNITSPTDPLMKRLVSEAFSPDVIASLKKDGYVLLDRERVVHIKHRGTDIEPFGESFIEPLMFDIGYKRALQSLDLATVDSLINRVVIIKIGSDNPDSEYHSVEYAQKRLMAFQRIYDDVSSSSMMLWAGPDVDVLDIGSHNKVLELDGRYKMAYDSLIFSAGVPEPLLNGRSSGQIWAAYEGFRESLRALQNSLRQMLIAVGERVAEANGFTGVEITFEFDRAVLADQTANANLLMRARREGVSSIRRTVSALGGDFETERRNRILERGLDPDTEQLPSDEELFSPPMGLPGDTRLDEGRPTDDESGRIPDTSPRDNRNPDDGE